MKDMEIVDAATLVTVRRSEYYRLDAALPAHPAVASLPRAISERLSIDAALPRDRIGAAAWRRLFVPVQRRPVLHDRIERGIEFCCA